MSANILADFVFYGLLLCIDYWNPDPPGEVYGFVQTARGELAIDPKFVNIVYKQLVWKGKDQLLV